MFKFNLSFSSLVLFFVLFSCKEKETIYKVCDCTSSKVEEFSAEPSLVALTRDGYKLISVKFGYLTPCKYLETDFQIDGQKVLLSGKIITTCTKDHSGTGLRSTFVEIINITKSDTILQNGNLTIEIIKTEDYGKDPGFGYIVNDIQKNFKIVQTQIPAGQGPFITKEDALKIGFVVLNRLSTKNDFPSIYLGDLYFLKIIDIQG